MSVYNSFALHGVLTTQHQTTKPPQTAVPKPHSGLLFEKRKQKTSSENKKASIFVKRKAKSPFLWKGFRIGLSYAECG